MTASEHECGSEWEYHTLDIYWYPHVSCYAREKLVAGFCFYFWKVIIFNPQYFSISIQLSYCLPSFGFQTSWKRPYGSRERQRCQPCLSPAANSSPPILLSWVLPGSAKPNRVFTCPPLSTSLPFAYFGKCK